MLLWYLFMVTAWGMPVHRVSETYQGAQSGWITLNLNRHVLGTKFATVKSVDWCSSVEPNPPHDSKAVIRELKTCSDSGLRHLRLFPSEEHLIENTAEDPNVIYIDPKTVGGWDSNHQAHIVVHAEFKDQEGKTNALVQTYRFNVLYKQSGSSHGPEIQEGEEGVTFVNEISLETHTPSSVSVSSHAPTASHASSAPAKEVFKSYGGMFSLLGIGFVVLMAAAYTVSSRKQFLNLPNWSKDQPRLTLRPPQEDDDDDDFGFLIVHEEEKKDEGMNLQFMMDLGANSAFLQNY